MAISFVAAGAVGTGANATAALPAGIAAGDLLIITTTGTATPTTPSGWTQRFAQGTGRFLTVLSKVATASESNVVLTQAGSTSKVVMVAYNGVGGFSAAGTVNTGSGTSASTTTFTTTIANSYVVSLYSRISGATSTFTTPASTTSRVNSSSSSTINGLLLVDELDAVAGLTTSRTTTLSNGDSWATYAFSLAPTENRYWVGGTGDWDSTTKWSASSGGASGASVPTGFDKVFVDTSSGTGTITAQTTSKSMAEFTVTATQAIGLSIANVTFFVSTATTLPSSGSFTITDSGTSNFSANGTLTSNSITFPSINVGTCTLSSNLTVTGRLQHLSGTFDTSSVGNYSVTAGNYYNTGTTTRAFNLNASTLTFTDAYVSPSTNAFYIQSSTNLTFNPGTSTINLSNAATGFGVGSGLTFYNIAFTNSDITSVVIRGSNTFNNLTFTSKASVGLCLITINGNQVINGTLTLGTANAANKRIYLSGGSAVRTLTVATVATLSDVDFRFITVAGASSPWAGTRLGNALNNSNIMFGAGKTVYWNLAGTQNWSATGWATSNNGTPALNNFPLAQDTAVFTETGAAGTITWDQSWNVGTIQMADGVSNRTTAFTLAGSLAFNIFGSVTLFSSLNLTATSGWFFGGSGITQGINFAGVTMLGNFSTSNVGGTVRLLNNLVSSLSQQSVLSGGTFDANGFNLTCYSISDNFSSGSTITLGSGTWTLTGVGSIWEIGAASVNASNSTIILSATGSTNKDFIGGSNTYGNLIIGGVTGSSNLTISGTNTFSTLSSVKNVAYKIIFANDQTIGTWSVTGTVGKVVTVESSVTGTQRNIGITNKTTAIDYLAIEDINGANINPITFWAGANSTNNGNNNNVIFANGALSEAYIITSGTSWTVPANFNSGLNAIYLFGGGGGGAGSSHAATLYRTGGGGGGGGAYTRLSNVPLTPTSSYTIAIGAAGTGGIGSTVGNSGGSGGQTTITVGATTYRANGGTGGSAFSSGSSISTGGTGGTAQSVSGLITAATDGGTGGAGSTTSTTNNNSSGGGGAGAGGPNGNGANGGTGTTGNTSSVAGGGGGGNGGGTAGGNAVTSTSGAGGNNSLGVGGGAAANGGDAGISGFSGGGGSGASRSATAGSGGKGNEISAAFGSGGGTGGRSYGGNNTASAGLYGAGGGGTGGFGTSSPVVYNGGSGAQGAIIVVYSLPIVINDSVTESATLADVVSAVRTSNDSIVENTILADIQIPPATYNLNITENVVMSDRSNTSEFEENINMADSSTAAIIYNDSINEGVSVADTVTSQATFNRSQTESVSVTDFTVGYGWFEINDAQAVTWTPIDNFQANNV